mgnify:CR=1 FL=1
MKNQLITELAIVKQHRSKHRKRQSKLNKFIYEIFELYDRQEASCADIALWLRSKKRTKVSRVTVWRFIKANKSSFILEEKC